MLEETCLQEITRSFKEGCLELMRHQLDPPTWHNKSVTAKEYMLGMLASQFKEFCLCKGFWKFEVYGTIKYSDVKENVAKGTCISKWVILLNSLSVCCRIRARC